MWPSQKNAFPIRSKGVSLKREALSSPDRVQLHDQTNDSQPPRNALTLHIPQ
ncbi:hypothetical protein Z945_1420 [Sulfitobacter noctilucae]|nr:hypothetical protein Z945_1420 [Sulfitobacter noctilucae]